ncbi:hypothetical protein FNV43_RR03359 [Rhamnella rubrinervis]|uniref:GTD-binding domain-containing protein n=1 Tax=Rhamnella rubrinervis TaxID=2594499 RepID=A0A8K0HHL4_9ROSA|nr:hypothetical protein FNV43_RR03359 [Rhamnella rubrinervis]
MCMAEGSTYYGMTDSDMTAMKEALLAQQQLLQKLYVELDEERESSATAASEALSMILRLQGEKAAVKMEASQYKRLAEEKICHAEESLEIFEDVIYQKEMEIASLEFQVQAYKCKLLSLGCSDLGATENRFPENLLFQGSDLSNGETSVSGNVRRTNSLPPIPLKDSQHEKNIGEREGSITPILDLVRKEVGQEVSVQSLNTEKKSGNCTGADSSSYWEQIRALDERVKQISHSKDSGRDKSTNSLSSQASTSTSCDPTRPGIISSLDQEKDNYNQQESEENASTSCSSNVHDIFEVPQIDEIWKIHEHQKKQESKLTVDVEDRLGKPDLVAQEIDDLCVKDEADCLKKMLLCTIHESTLCKPTGSVDCNVATVCPTTGVAESQAKFQQLCRRIDQLEGERNSTSQEISYAGDEERKLLREIHDQLNQIQAEIRNWGMNKSPPQDEQLSQIQTEIRSQRIQKSPSHDEQPLLSLMEAMLHFWL